MTSSQPGSASPEAKQFIAIAVIGTLVLAGLLALWLTEIVPFGVFITGVVVLVLAEFAVVLLGQRRRRERAARAERLSSDGGTSTIDEDSPNARYGYDPTDGLPGAGR